MSYTPHEFALNLFDAMPGFVAVDDKGIIVFIRDHYAAVLGTTKENAIGRPIGEVIANSRLPDVLKQQKPQLGQRHRSQSSITGGYISESIYNRLPIKDCNNPERIIGAMEFIVVDEYQDKDAMMAEMEYLRQENALYRKQIAMLYQPGDDLEEILGCSVKVAEMKELIQRVADTAASVCISGETGTGKELVANAVHKLSRRKKEPFIKINCAAIPRDLMESELFGYEAGAFTGAAKQGKIGVFELANGGTLLLDEIGELPLELQAKLLRALQEREIKRVGGLKQIPVDVRILCSTNRNLKDMVAEGRFRADLYYRINTLEIVVPPLRERPEDIPLLADHFIRTANKVHGLAISGMQPQVYQILSSQHWPGNVRELEHSIERACILCGAGDLKETHFGFAQEVNSPVVQEPERKQEQLPYRVRQEELELEEILHALETCKGNRVKTAEMLEISRATLFRKMKKHNLL